MIYERDSESPFSKIVVKNGSSAVGTIRRNLITGHYHFYDNQHGGLNCLLQEKRIDSLKTRIEELIDLAGAG
jgi:hypothetical protein